MNEQIIERALTVAGKCPNCEIEDKINERYVTEWFDYGNYRKAFQVRFPVLTCSGCDFSWRDQRSETLIDKAMGAFIQTRGWQANNLK